MSPTAGPLSFTTAAHLCSGGASKFTVYVGTLGLKNIKLSSIYGEFLTTYTCAVSCSVIFSSRHIFNKNLQKDAIFKCLYKFSYFVKSSFDLNMNVSTPPYNNDLQLPSLWWILANNTFFFELKIESKF